jgi:hypothetical protein
VRDSFLKPAIIKGLGFVQHFLMRDAPGMAKTR